MTDQIACTLPTAEMPDRMAAWRAVIDVALSHEATAAGVRLSLPRDPELVAQVAELAAREQECCSFFTFTIILCAPSQFLLEVGAPEDTRVLVQELFTASAAGPTEPPS